MTESTYPLSTALSAAQHADACNAAELCLAMTHALVREGALLSADAGKAHAEMVIACCRAVDTALVANGELDNQTRRSAAEVGVAALRDAGLIVDEVLS